jgi:hypothetical protein
MEASLEREGPVQLSLLYTLRTQTWKKQNAVFSPNYSCPCARKIKMVNRLGVIPS